MSRIKRLTARHPSRVETGMVRKQRSDDLVDQLVAAAADLTDDQVARIAATLAERPGHLARLAATALRIVRAVVIRAGAAGATALLWLHDPSAARLVPCLLLLLLWWVLSEDDRTNRVRALIYPTHGPAGGDSSKTRPCDAKRRAWWHAIRR